MSQLQQPQINLAQTTEVLTESGNKIFAEGVILRRASKFLTGSPEDMYLPIPVYYDPISFEIAWELVSPEIRALYGK